MKKGFLIAALSLLLELLGAAPAYASGFQYTIASQFDESFLCAPDWENCFTNNQAQAVIPLGEGSTLGGGTIVSVTIARDPNSGYAPDPWVTGFLCFTDSAYTTPCPDWVRPTSLNGYRSDLIDEPATTTADGTHWTAYFTNVNDWRNYDDNTNPIRFLPNYYYQLIINDNGWNIGAFGSESKGLPYFVVTGIKDTPDPVVIIPGILGSWEKNGQWVLDPLLHTYDNLIDTFIANGYVKDKTIFTFPYDWEQPNEVTAFQLKNKIAEIKTTCNCSKVDLIGHSMGGLVAANYIERDDYAHDVDQLFFVATPLSGAPKAYKAWEGGELDFADQTQNFFIRTLFRLEALKNGYSTIYEYIRNKPVVSIQELLPINVSYLKTNSDILIYPNGYPNNLFLEKLVGEFSKIRQSGVVIKTILADTKTTSTIGGYVIASSTKPTLWPDGEPISTIFTDGDGTVPRTSIESVAPINKEFDFVTHVGIVSSSISYLFKEITNKDPEVVSDKKYNAIKSFLFFKLFSPIDMQVIAPDGKKLGKDFTSNTEINEIPEAFYSGFITDNEYAIIPNPIPGEYKVAVIGTGNGGSYNIAVEYADTGTSSEIIITGTSTPVSQQDYNFIVSATSTSISLPPPVATSTPTSTVITPDTCIQDITAAYQNKWIGKKIIYEKLVFDCRVLKELLRTRDTIEKIAPNKRKPAEKVLLAATYTAIKLTIADMEFLAKDKNNTKDAVLLIGKITIWFKSHLF